MSCVHTDFLRHGCFLLLSGMLPNTVNTLYSLYSFGDENLFLPVQIAETLEVAPVEIIADIPPPELNRANSTHRSMGLGTAVLNESDIAETEEPRADSGALMENNTADRPDSAVQLAGTAAQAAFMASSSSASSATPPAIPTVGSSTHHTSAATPTLAVPVSLPAAAQFSLDVLTGSVPLCVRIANQYFEKVVKMA